MSEITYDDPCDHRTVIPLGDGWGRCVECGDEGFPMDERAAPNLDADVDLPRPIRTVGTELDPAKAYLSAVLAEAPDLALIANARTFLLNTTRGNDKTLPTMTVVISTQVAKSLRGDPENSEVEAYIAIVRRVRPEAK